MYMAAIRSYLGNPWEAMQNHPKTTLTVTATAATIINAPLAIGFAGVAAMPSATVVVFTGLIIDPALAFIAYKVIKLITALKNSSGGSNSAERNRTLPLLEDAGPPKHV